MNQNPDNYQTDFNQNQLENYDDYYYYENFQGECGDVPNIQAPDVKLYAKGFSEFNNNYSDHSDYYEPVMPVEMYDGQYMRSSSVPTAKYFYETVPSHCYYKNQRITHVPKKIHSHQVYAGNNTDQDATWFQKNNIDYPNEYENNRYYFEKYEYDSRMYEKIQQSNMYSRDFQANAENEPHMQAAPRNNEKHPDLKAKFYDPVNKINGRVAPKKYPITVKTPKYVNKNAMPTNVKKRASVLCLPVITQADPALVKRKSKTNQTIKKHALNYYDQKETYSAHKMNSQGDVKMPLAAECFDQVFDNYESHLLSKDSNKNELTESTFKNFMDDENRFKIQELAKFMKPRVPNSVKMRQQRLLTPNMATSTSLKPKMKLSFDKLLNRLQKCETPENVDTLSGISSKRESGRKKNNISENKTIIDAKTLDSFNYEELSKKWAPTMREKSCQSLLENSRKEATNNSNNDNENKVVANPLKCKESFKQIKPMDDQCALDLHKSKSYIVDLIDRALSKELGTIPRDHKIHHNLTPNKAVATISRHQETNQKELCYELTAALTDSIISNVTAPEKSEIKTLVEKRSRDLQKASSDECYIKQLKHLRWGHIRHIQREARKLADLEEFLENFGETD
ncbi:hypothetical protein ABEB36_003542 [Hypothenemus hampei]|uniref:Uncharacterized protein n=1 Tax=Hypothenemus hampei TaxID=57062 RepID=A0ABD1F9H4_HYPHA